MWRIIIFGALGIVIGTRARSERGVALMSLFFGLLYGAAALVSSAAINGPPSAGRALYFLGLGLVLAAPVYAIGEIWRRSRARALSWLRRLLRS
jgi:hypothetical protein